MQSRKDSTNKLSNSKYKVRQHPYHLFLDFPVEIAESPEHEVSDFRAASAKVDQHFRANSSNDGLRFEHQHSGHELGDVKVFSIDRQQLEEKLGRRGSNKAVRVAALLDGEFDQVIDGKLIDTPPGKFGRQTQETV
jgi:hypothetical protein